MPPRSVSFLHQVDLDVPGWPWSEHWSCRPRLRRPPTPLLLTGSSNSCNGSRWQARATDIRTISLAFWVASSFSLEWTQEQCSRIFAISKKYWLIPASRSVSRNSGSCVLGVQAATTTRLSPFSLISVGYLFGGIRWHRKRGSLRRGRHWAGSGRIRRWKEHRPRGRYWPRNDRQRLLSWLFLFETSSRIDPLFGQLARR